MQVPSRQDTLAAATALMEAFARDTGLTGEGPGQRYLWTDAFAVCTFLALARRTGQSCHLDLALHLVEQVHLSLGRHRSDDQRKGWISGLPQEEALAHPTRGGLRIGKRLAERRADQPLNDVLEWERDGQYFHYLTKWMRALDLVARTTGQPLFHRWACELARAAHDAFVYDSAGDGRRMFWKMSIDLSRPLVAAMGHHDPLDGYLTCVEIQHTGAEFGLAQEQADLRGPIHDFASMIEQRDLATADPLGIGGLLTDAARVAQLMGAEDLEGEPLMDALFLAAAEGLAYFSRGGELARPASQRLAFRELGLAIGLSAVDLIARDVQAGRLRFAASAGFADGMESLEPFAALGPGIVSFWMEPSHQESRSWRDHRAINMAMLASSLVPEGCVRIPPLEHAHS